jgi:hypothetical protein
MKAARFLQRLRENLTRLGEAHCQPAMNCLSPAA